MRLLLVVSLLSAGCASTIQGAAEMPNPALYPDPDEDGRIVSDGIAIRTKDVEMVGFEPSAAPRMSGGLAVRRDPVFFQTAYFEMRSPARIDFLVQLVHRNVEDADPTRQEIWLEDDQGRRFRPSAVDTDASRTQRVNMNLGRTGVTVMQVRGAGWRYNMQVDQSSDRSAEMLQRRALVSFRGGPMLTERTRSLSLVLQAAHRTGRFTWHFTREPTDSAARVRD